MEIVLVVAVLVVAVAVLYVAVTLGPRTRQSTAPMIDEAAKDISGRIEDLKGQLTAIAGELEQDRDHTRVEGRKIQGRLDHADSRTGSIANRLLAEMDTIRRLGEQVSARQDQLSDDLRQLDQQVARLQAGQEAPDVVTAGSSRPCLASFTSNDCGSRSSASSRSLFPGPSGGTASRSNATWESCPPRGLATHWR